MDDDFGEAAYEARTERDQYNEFGEFERDRILECGHHEDDCDCEDPS